MIDPSRFVPRLGMTVGELEDIIRRSVYEELQKRGIDIVQTPNKIAA